MLNPLYDVMFTGYYWLVLEIDGPQASRIHCTKRRAGDLEKTRSSLFLIRITIVTESSVEGSKTVERKRA